MLKHFLESPANRAGLSAWLATALTALAQYAVTRSLPPLADSLGIVIGLVAILQPDNSVTVAQLEKAIMDARDALTRKNATSINAVIADAEGIIAGVASTTPAK